MAVRGATPCAISAASGIAGQGRLPKSFHFDKLACARVRWDWEPSVRATPGGGQAENRIGDPAQTGGWNGHGAGGDIESIVSGDNMCASSKSDAGARPWRGISSRGRGRLRQLTVPTLYPVLSVARTVPCHTADIGMCYPGESAVSSQPNNERCP